MRNLTVYCSLLECSTEVRIKNSVFKFRDNTLISNPKANSKIMKKDYQTKILE